MTPLFNSKVTIYNDIPADSVNPRRFDRFVIDKCDIQGGYVGKADGTVQNIVNAKTVITKDIEHYKAPNDYVKLPLDLKESYFTVQVDDFVVFDEADDVVTTSREFQTLQEKYKNNGMLITAVNPYVFGTDIDNVTMTNA